MPLKQSYVVWNNKGGAGKTTLVFHLATQYARTNQETRVVVLDMCPQANVSMALLTQRDRTGYGSSGEEIVRHVTSLKVNDKYEKTVCGYLQAMVEKDRVDFEQFLTKANEYNTNVTGNVYVLCGDKYLEFLSKRLDQERRMDQLYLENPWKRVTLLLKHFIDEVCKKLQHIEFMFFIDTNPAFALYTELAISAATRLIVPVNADDFSKAAVDAMLYLIYGIATKPDNRSSRLEKLQYHWKVKQDETKIDLPKIHLVVNNKAKYHHTRVAGAFDAKSTEITDVLREIYQTNPEIFSETDDRPPVQFDPSKYTADLMDFHSQAVLSLHTGSPLAITHGQYTMLNGKKVKQSYDTKAGHILDDIVERL